MINYNKYNFFLNNSLKPCYQEVILYLYFDVISIPNNYMYVFILLIYLHMLNFVRRKSIFTDGQLTVMYHDVNQPNKKNK